MTDNEYDQWLEEYRAALGERGVRSLVPGLAASNCDACRLLLHSVEGCESDEGDQYGP